MTEDPIIQKPVDYSLDDRDFCHERVKRKPDLFNLFFAKRCTLADNASTLPIGSYKKQQTLFLPFASAKMMLQKLSKTLINLKLATMVCSVFVC